MTANLAQCIERATAWLTSIRDQDSGGWGEYQGATANSLNTAEAILALLESKEQKAGDEAIQAGVRFLEAHQLPGKHAAHHAGKDHAALHAKKEHAAHHPEKTKDGAWAREVPRGNGATDLLPDTVRTGFALLALNAAGKSCEDDSVRRGVQWLLHTVNPDGGWGYAPAGPSQLFPTCMALRVMLRLRRASDAVKEKVDEPIKEGLKYLYDTYHKDDGSFGNVPHSLYVLRVLLHATPEGFQIAKHAIDDVVGWIDQQGAPITQWFSEPIKLGDGEGASYTFTHVTPALYLDTFGDRLSAKNAVAQESMIVMHENMDPVSCGMSGKRPVSWATAKALLGFSAVVKIFPTFPEREIPLAQVTGRHYLLGFLLLILAAATAVALAGKISVQYVGLLSGLVLAGLLIYGLISEKSFLQAYTTKVKIKDKQPTE